MSELRDPNAYYDYLPVVYDSLYWPPKYPKSSCLLSAAVHDNVEKLKVLLDSPEWYEVTDRKGNTLLHIAVKRNSVEVFNHLLSLDDYPLNAVNESQKTALMTCVRRRHENTKYFLKTLIRGGASLNLQQRYNIYSYCLKIGKILFNTEFVVVETVAMLLYYRADLSITDAFKTYVTQCLYFYHIWIDRSYSLVEHLLNLTYDELESYDIDLNVLIELADRKCPLFHKVYDCVEDVQIVHWISEAYTGLFQIDLKYLKLLVEKFEDTIGEVLLTRNCLYLNIRGVRLENVEFLLESNLRSETLEAITGRDPSLYLTNLVISGYEEMAKKRVTETYCFLLSYGMKISSRDLDFIHEHYPNSELFKMLLHMEIEIIDDDDPKFARLYYDIRRDVESFRLPLELTSYETDLLLGLCAHQKMKNHCLKYGHIVARKVKNLPQMPSLVELARNIFRNYFIENMKITSARQFYTMINSFPVSNIYKDIITYQRKIY